MGIKALIKLIKLNSPTSLQEIYLPQLRGKTLAVDASIFIYEAKYKMNFNTNTFLENFEKKLIPFFNSEINLIFVFDGESPIEKKKTLEKRKDHKIKTMERINQIADPASRELKLRKQIIDVSRQNFDDAKICLANFKIKYYQSKNEAEASCAKLVKEGNADYVLSNDSDTLAFGSSFIFKKKSLFYMIDLQHLLKSLELTQEKFVFICVLLGCDYSRSPKKVNLSNVFFIIKSFSGLDEYLEKNTIMTEEDKLTLKRSEELFMSLGEYNKN